MLCTYCVGAIGILYGAWLEMFVCKTPGVKRCVAASTLLTWPPVRVVAKGHVVAVWLPCGCRVVAVCRTPSGQSAEVSVFRCIDALLHVRTVDASKASRI